MIFATEADNTYIETTVPGNDGELFLGDVLEAFGQFLRAAGFTYVVQVGVRTDNQLGFSTYEPTIADEFFADDEDDLEWDQEAFENSKYGC